jgi:hypothetical protein
LRCRAEGFLLGKTDLYCLRALLALLDLELHSLTFVQGTVTGHLDFRLMNEKVLRTVVGNDETESLVGVKPLDYTCPHEIPRIFGLTQ